MQLVRSKPEHIEELVRISKSAFDSDTAVGATEAGGPPDYDSEEWHMEMMRGGHLFTAVEQDTIVGGAIVFVDENNPTRLYVGRIFVDPSAFCKGYGCAIMEQIEENYPAVSVLELDTPAWNVRTNRFYKKIGYTEIKNDGEDVFYRKIK
ncbi:MAG: GNAT family N-acetyltransferase [Ruminococcus bromii]|nr:GNAT family N-acetyltransferase [Ruminococcus bromii]